MGKAPDGLFRLSRPCASGKLQGRATLFMFGSPARRAGVPPVSAVVNAFNFHHRRQ